MTEFCAMPNFSASFFETQTRLNTLSWFINYHSICILWSWQLASYF